MAEPSRAVSHAPPQSPGLSYAGVSGQVAEIALDPAISRRLWVAIAASGLLVAVLLVALYVLFAYGVGVWGLNQPVVWALDIINTVWWGGIGLAGLVSTGLMLLVLGPAHNPLGRFAESMALFAALCAALFPVLHLGRPWLFYWMAPYASANAVWPQFRSPLAWDFFGFSTYVVAVALLWFVGLIPDVAVLRDQARTRLARFAYGLLALGWRGSALHWKRWRHVKLILAGIAVPLAVLIHSGAAMLFAGSPLAGWHTTILPYTFTVGAVFSGFAVMAMLAVALRANFAVHNLLTARHLDHLGIALLVTGLLTAYGYLAEAFDALYAGRHEEVGTLMDRVAGEYAWAYWGAVLLNFVPLQLLWWRRLRGSPAVLASVGLAVTVGMWLERYMLLVTTLYHGPVPAAWGHFTPTVWDWALFAGTAGLFLFFFLLFLQFLPAIGIAGVQHGIYHSRREDASHG